MTTARIILVTLFASACAGTLPGVESGTERDMMPASHLELSTADGEISGVDRRDPSRELSEGLMIELRDDDDRPLAVRLAPGWYLDEQGIAYGPRERLSVRGHRSVQNGEPVFVVNEVRQNGRWVRLRDASGRPLWTGAEPKR